MGEEFDETGGYNRGRRAPTSFGSFFREHRHRFDRDARAGARKLHPNRTQDDAIVVTGIRSSLQSALNEKRNAASLVEIIQAEDIGKLPDQNLAEVLENIPGIQITREAGIGTGVQIRGSNDNRTEINGVGTVGSGSGRGGSVLKT